MLDFVIFTLIFIGIILIIYSIIKFTPIRNPSQTNLDEIITKDAINQIQTALNEADETIEELYKLSQTMLDEINSKYKELAYLYHIIDEKQKEIENNKIMYMQTFDYGVLHNQKTKQTKDNKPKAIQTKNTKLKKIIPKKQTQEHIKINSMLKTLNSQHGEIRKLALEGKNIQEIAKELKIGQDEVRLVLNLQKH